MSNVIHVDGWILCPWLGQRRFGLKIDEKGDVTFVPRRPQLDGYFESQPSIQPTCSDLNPDTEEDRVNLILEAVNPFLLLEEGDCDTKSWKDGSRVVFYHPRLDIQ